MKKISNYCFVFSVWDSQVLQISVVCTPHQQLTHFILLPADFIVHQTHVSGLQYITRSFYRQPPNFVRMKVLSLCIYMKDLASVIFYLDLTCVIKWVLIMLYEFRILMGNSFLRHKRKNYHPLSGHQSGCKELLQQ